jgi:hypothetical protein
MHRRTFGASFAALSVGAVVGASSAHAQESPIMYDVTDYGAVGDGIANDAPAIQAAIDAAWSTGGEIVIPAGNFRIASSVTANMLGGGSQLTIRGAGGATRLHIATPMPLAVHNLDGVLSFRDFVMVGSQSGDNCIAAISAHGCGQAVFERVSAYGVGCNGAPYLAEWGALVRLFNCPAQFRSCAFYGSYGQAGLISVEQLRGIVLEDVHFIDIGALGGVTYNKVGGVGGPWLRVNHLAAQGFTATSQMSVRVSRCIFDEGPGVGIIVDGAERVRRVDITDCMYNIGGSGYAARLSNVENLTIDGGAIGWAHSNRDALRLEDVGTARIDNVKTQQDRVLRLTADSACRYLRTRESDFAEVVSAAQTTIIEVDGVVQ